MSGAGRIAVVDLGKTSTKVAVVDDAGGVVEERRTPAAVVPGPPYPHLDVERAFAWILGELRALLALHPIETIVPVAHGAAAALLAGDELALPVMDYEFAGPDELAETYPAPPFEETLSPRLPAGLNLGRQLHWQSVRMPDAFARVTHVLPYAQYAGWRLSGRMASEVTSLGCHTDLWAPRSRAFSSLAKARGWDELFPPIEPAWAELGPATALSSSCRVLVGIHDSNASFLPHRTSLRPPFSVVSTGTWVVCMAAGGSLDALDPAAGALANVDVFGDPVPTCRFMGGRELEAIAGAGGRIEAVSLEDVQRVVDRMDFASTEDAARGVLASALKTDRCLDLVGARGPCIVEGSFVRTPAFVALLAALPKGGEVFAAEEVSGTTTGAAVLARWPAAIARTEPKRVRPAAIDGLDGYRAGWSAPSSTGISRPEQSRTGPSNPDGSRAESRS
jgi:sugar (pentulose or hexulose) kinase